MVSIFYDRVHILGFNNTEGVNMDLALLKMSGGVLVPSIPSDAEVIRLMPLGTIIQAQGRGRRNPAFHRRFFALLNLTFDNWELTGG
ncbi:DUF1367 family protein [Aeromonas hydrophila]|uniref:DUF1367 family protein n=3 Tax=Aeromonas hydrophila TaxID=644 RepID=UPI0027DC79E9|nr:DUF1367 family protein [Aeromonas hydrophila]